MILGCLGCRTKTLRRKYSEVAWSVVEEELNEFLMFAEYSGEMNGIDMQKGREEEVTYCTEPFQKKNCPADHSNAAQDDSSSCSSSCSITNTTHSTDLIISVSGIRLRYTETPQV